MMCFLFSGRWLSDHDKYTISHEAYYIIEKKYIIAQRGEMVHSRFHTNLMLYIT